VFIVDDQPLMREGLNVLLATLTRHLVVGTTGGASDALSMAMAARPEVVLIDANLPAGGAFELGRRLSSRVVGIRMIFLDEQFDEVSLRSAIEVDAAGYLLKSESFERVIWALDQMVEDKPAFCHDAAARLTKHNLGFRLARRNPSPVFQRLTPRELEVLEHLTKGLTVRQTARAMELAESTVDNHKSSLMGKLQVHRQIDLIRLAAREGLGDDSE
jgi:DNA-binding NarL/FixJ family response regulator